jgi:hypothetical protein
VWIVSAHLIQPDGGKVKPREGPLAIAMLAIPSMRRCSTCLASVTISRIWS